MVGSPETQASAARIIARCLIRECPHPAFASMMRIAHDREIIKNFARDLVCHDYDALRDSARGAKGRDSRSPFAWCIYENGTALVWLDARLHLDASHVRAADECAHGVGAWFLWNGSNLIEFPNASALIDFCNALSESDQ